MARAGHALTDRDLPVTAGQLDYYLTHHPVAPVRKWPSTGTSAVPGQEQPAPEFLIQDAASDTWFVRFPNGSLRWVSAAWLLSRGFTPTAPRLSADSPTLIRTAEPLPDEAP